MSVGDRESITAEQAVASLRDEVLRLRRLHGVDLGAPYIHWRNRLRDLMDFGPEYEAAFQELLKLYETGAA